MNQETVQATPKGEDYRWIQCNGCGGAVGIPTDWTDNTVECPRCRLPVHVRGRVVYRPPAQARSATGPQNRQPSLELIRKADSAMVYGIVSVLLGWTIIVPVSGVLTFNEASDMAKKEQVLVPGKATVGLVLSLLFGVSQGLVLISRFFFVR
jgi:hypothetical protein